MKLDKAHRQSLDPQVEADAPAVDTTLVEHLITLTYEERIDAHESVRELVHDLMQAGRKYYARQSKDSGSDRHPQVSEASRRGSL